MKRILSIILSAAIALCFASCADKEGAGKQNSSKLSVVATIFPEYDWVREIAGERLNDIDLALLLDNGVDLHSYQPTAEDIMKISKCDVFIYVGGESDKWVADALNEATNKDMVVVNLLECLGDAVKEEEIVEGMEAEDEHEEGEADGEEEAEYDEHVWLSLKNSEKLVSKITDALCKADPEYSDTYKSNADAYLEKLGELDKEYKSAVDSSAHKTLLFADRFPFRYLTDDYGITYYAAFAGCSAETEASFETIAFLSKKVDELGLKCVMTLEGADGKIAETIIQNTSTRDQKILSLDSMQGMTSDDLNNGATYLKVMEDNLEVLKEALN